jgi:arylsulfatase A-like enzyme
MDEKRPEEKKPEEKKRRRITRRNFVGTMGAAAAAGAFLQRGRSQSAAPSQLHYYQDSFGQVVPAGRGALDLGIHLPPVPAHLAPQDAANADVRAPGGNNATYYTSGYPLYNILLIIVDQMRNPAFWLPSGNNWVTTYQDTLPNITSLAQQSFVFPNYWVAATACTPSRACLLTGLYSQQTCIFQTAAGQVTPPPLLPYNGNSNGSNNANVGFPTIGNVLSQSLPVAGGGGPIQYDCTWIGKWHLSCENAKRNGQPGENGPSDYGFNSTYSIPSTGNNNSAQYPYPSGNNGYPSPDGVLNGGAGGDFLDAYTQNGNSNHDSTNYGYNNANAPLQYNNNNNAVAPIPGFTQINDAAIARAFTNYWLPAANLNLNTIGNNNQLTTPWFCAVSFINPHDISDFPWASGLTQSNNTNAAYQRPTGPTTTGYQPAPMNTSGNINYYGTDCGNNNSCAADGDVTTIRNYPSTLYSNLPPGLGNTGPWNYESLTTPYANNGKPGAQLSFLTRYLEPGSGIIKSPGTYSNSNNSWSAPDAWKTFLNYYAWLQSDVDYQVGQVLGNNNGLQQYPTFWNNTVIIFTADHGDFGGSHSLHAKAGAVYEEALNVPLLISYPSMRNNNSGMIALPYVCSSVDLLPFLYTLALGNHSWRNNTEDLVYYLGNRESINDPINQYNANSSNNTLLQQRRISGIPNYNDAGSAVWQRYQPFVFHTTDEFPTANNGTAYQPSHAIAFRTVDLTDPNNNSAPFAGQTSYGGGKLGIYSYWDTCHQNSAPVMGINSNAAPNQYEFYNYSPHPPAGNLAANPQELGNHYFDANNTSGGLSSQGQLYYEDWFNIGSNNGVNIQNELYQLYSYNNNSGNSTLQVAAATQVAYQNYLEYLANLPGLTGNNGSTGVIGNNNTSCPHCDLAGNNNYNP